ncbi:phytoene desaturase family protein [Mucilaginibacter humi]|uniref:phytoene desaturase family protein n=1 Tax=Mucilaginibacter humi TaxID=2732510 RepID=UPI00293BF9E8|nr:FAD-dependent oxidoreductase [Mucilaginibacter humi]
MSNKTPKVSYTDEPAVAVIGSGFSGLSAAAYLAKAGSTVNVYEKNTEIGGRARQLIANGYTFDMGPSWYWMPEVFEPSLTTLVIRHQTFTN